MELINIRATIRRFNVTDFQKHVILCFPSHLQEIARRTIKQKSKKVMLDQLMSVVKKEKKRTLQALHLRLCTVLVSLHSQRKNWHAYKFENPQNRLADVLSLHRRLVQGCRINGLECDVDILQNENILWFTLILKRVIRKRGLVRTKPKFFAHILGTPFLFCSDVLQANIKESFLHAFSLRSVANLSLFGRDIKSLHTILLRKEGKVASLTELNYKVGKPKVCFGNRDYTQHEIRTQFAGKCFPVDAKFETLTLRNEESVWKGDLETQDGENLQLRMVVKILSKNVFSALKSFCENNVIQPEHSAAYALKLGEGKNKIDVPVLINGEHVND